MCHLSYFDSKYICATQIQKLVTSHSTLLPTVCDKIRKTILCHNKTIRHMFNYILHSLPQDNGTAAPNNLIC